MPCVRSAIDYAAPVFLNGLPQYLKNQLARLEKRPLSITTPGKCKLAIEAGVIPILEHRYVPCSKLFDNIVSDPNHELKVLLSQVYGSSRYNLRRQLHFNMPSFLQTEHVLPLYMRCGNSRGYSLIPLMFIFYILTQIHNIELQILL